MPVVPSAPTNAMSQYSVAPQFLFFLQALCASVLGVVAVDCVLLPSGPGVAVQGPGSCSGPHLAGQIPEYDRQPAHEMQSPHLPSVRQYFESEHWR